ncbi:MAG: SDR family oxidoreductase [Pseudomonadota bacterium]
MSAAGGQPSSAEPLSLAGRAIIVTGGSRGLGREMAIALAQAGANLMLTGASESTALAESVAIVRSHLRDGAEAHAMVTDVRDPAACARTVAETVDRFGKLDVLVNNAGLGMRAVSETFNTEPTRFWETSPEAWNAIVDTNINGAFYAARVAAAAMVERGYGKIVNVSTSAKTMVRRGYSPYGPTKAALEAASRIWAHDLAGTGVDVNVYLPGGASDTDLLPPGMKRTGADGSLLPASIMRRGIVWLCSARSDGVTGARFTARLWDEALPPDEAAQASRSPAAGEPAIM